MIDEPYVNHVSIMTGGVKYKDLKRFYTDCFILGNPSNMKMKLLSRIIDTYKVMNELHISFTYTTEVP
jgi:carboxymethylenebutenolidase